MASRMNWQRAAQRDRMRQFGTEPVGVAAAGKGTRKKKRKPPAHGYIVITAKFATRCAICKAGIAAGAQMWWNGDTKERHCMKHPPKPAKIAAKRGRALDQKLGLSKGVPTPADGVPPWI